MIENQIVTPLASAVRAATTNSDAQANRFHRGVEVALNVSAAPGVDTVTLSIEAQDPVSGTWYAILTGAAVVAAGLTTYRVYSGIAETANVAVNRTLPRGWRVKVTHSAATNFTYSVGATLLV